MISQKQQRELDEQGAVVITDVLSDEEIEAYKERLLSLAAAEKGDKSAILHTDGKGQHIRWLVNKGERFSLTPSPGRRTGSMRPNLGQCWRYL